MTDEDLDRVDTLPAWAIQLQELAEGTDLWVHVVGERVFASRILSETSDYRYDKDAEVEAVDQAEAHRSPPLTDSSKF